MRPQPTARLLISCPDTRGIIAAVTAFIAAHTGNIIELDQHTDDPTNHFYMRVEVEVRGFDLSPATFSAAWLPLAEKFGMKWRVTWEPAHEDDTAGTPQECPATSGKRVVILASKEGHCLSDLLFRWKTGELEASIVGVISNHQDLAPLAHAAAVPFYYVPIVGGNKVDQESRLRTQIDALGADLLVLARYMQILSPSFVRDYPQQIINIHHSFLPAFVGPKPYHQAFDRGVKIIGATSHYVTDELDAGPIIAQSVADVGHRDTVGDMIRKGRDLERIVLARAVRLHVSDRILIGSNKTVVFE
jgi:formyltetrahydrofolate deformylase